MDYATRARIERQGERIIVLEGEVALLREIVQLLVDRQRGRPSIEAQEKLKHLKAALNDGAHNRH